MIIPQESQGLINKCKNGKTGALKNQPGFEWILNTTSFLPDGVPIAQRIFHIENKILDLL